MSKGRSAFLITVIVLIALAVSVRLFELIVVNGAEYLKISENEPEHTKNALAKTNH